LYRQSALADEPTKPAHCQAHLPGATMQLANKTRRMKALLNPELLQVLACPWDHTPLHISDSGLVCENAHSFTLEADTPIFTEHVRREPVPRNMEPCAHLDANGPIDPFVRDWLVNTNGNLYWRARSRLQRYPIPHWPFQGGEGRLLVDVGCGWGRWTIAAAQAGYIPVGMDVHIDALEAASRVSRQVGVRADYVCADVEHLPFRSGSIDVFFSYSVLQHLERSKVKGFLKEVSRTLSSQGVCLIQLPNTLGPYNLVQQARRRFRDGRPGTFEMRYWSRHAIEQAVAEAGLRDLTIRADGFFTQNPQLADLDLLSLGGKLVVLGSHAGRRAAAVFPVLTRLADSLWIEARSAEACNK